MWRHLVGVWKQIKAEKNIINKKKEIKWEYNAPFNNEMHSLSVIFNKTKLFNDLITLESE